ncbi:hypothetical protein GZH47_32095 (plasmid) [Paenibacillus rhizovicinus]|uniref:DUF1080 domain-containing protein n=1 Tax=Paenibacillus rhizovicinus TaxID=2704463 RepID=A0A6C0PAA9_9BACL|nr:hypothetical protein [Paenibacillus rhizovicinus]QHW35530.1 hypothetical protein GZH47_32095 [Paenibacillus rhizovicinus]
MIQLINKQFDPDNCEVLHETRFADEDFREDWRIYGGDWWTEDGWLNGKNMANAPGVIMSKRSFPGNVLIEFEGRTVLPSTHDIDMMWNASWDEQTGQRGAAYVAGIEGWWEGKVGIEKSPGYTLNAATPLFDFDPGRTYRIQAGSIDGHCFVCVDGKLLLELTDHEPIDAQIHTGVGFEAYASFIQIRNLTVRRLSWEPILRSYPDEFR